jgi:hypothetical protein
MRSASVILIKHVLITSISQDDFTMLVDDELAFLKLDFCLEAPSLDRPGMEDLQAFSKLG